MFQIGSGLTTASDASVSVLNGGSDSGIFWQVGSSATLGTGTSFAGNIIADQSITMATGASILCGRAIALVGAVTMDTNTVSNDCDAFGGDPDGGDPTSSDFSSFGFSGADVDGNGNGNGNGPGVIPLPAAGFLLLGALGGFGLLRAVSGGGGRQRISRGM